jgi:hypothetical protein
MDEELFKVQNATVGYRFGLNFHDGSCTEIIDNIKQEHFDAGWSMICDDEKQMTFISPDKEWFKSWNKESGRCVQFSREWITNLKITSNKAS